MVHAAFYRYQADEQMLELLPDDCQALISFSSAAPRAGNITDLIWRGPRIVEEANCSYAPLRSRRARAERP
jgi:hypothetical protein